MYTPRTSTSTSWRLEKGPDPFENGELVTMRLSEGVVCVSVTWQDTYYIHIIIHLSSIPSTVTDAV